MLQMTWSYPSEVLYESLPITIEDVGFTITWFGTTRYRVDMNQGCLSATDQIDSKMNKEQDSDSLKMGWVGNWKSDEKYEQLECGGGGPLHIWKAKNIDGSLLYNIIYLHVRAENNLYCSQFVRSENDQMTLATICWNMITYWRLYRSCNCWITDASVELVTKYGRR